ncbi:hypothetical protein SAMN02745132_00669 [Enterovibrio nigricans DSM 22720]|uniref:Uncharacterized protein n=1 Tax=Enterovibrio nigricans DSM 22720 TaxID=1121868 RepID=A0A1T4U3E9_9GAMM|nr:hypothetical protein SAMN02745132_00669 [Enterovibrio nigricans DSM 22720]
MIDLIVIVQKNKLVIYQTTSHKWYFCAPQDKGLPIVCFQSIAPLQAFFSTMPQHLADFHFRKSRFLIVQ